MQYNIRNNIEIFGNTLINFNVFKFNDGTLKVEIPNFESYEMVDDFNISCYATSMNDIIIVGLIVDIIKRKSRVFNKINLTLQSALYTRYDRVMVSNDAFGLKVFANMVKATGVDKVTFIDCHSDVTRQIFSDIFGADNFKNKSQHGCIEDVFLYSTEVKNFRQFWLNDDSEYLVILPDKGASKKMGFIVNKIQMIKNRDPETGKLGGFSIEPESLSEIKSELDSFKRMIIVDDLCENGGTFLGCLSELRKQGITLPCDLYVTHGIFPQIEAYTKLGEVFENIFIYNCKLGTYNDLRSFSGTNIYALNLFN